MLHKLPTEIILAIFDYQSTTELLSLRVLNKGFYSLLNNTIRKRMFSQLHLTLQNAHLYKKLTHLSNIEYYIFITCVSIIEAYNIDPATPELLKINFINTHFKRGFFRVRTQKKISSLIYTFLLYTTINMPLIEKYVFAYDFNPKVEIESIKYDTFYENQPPRIDDDFTMISYYVNSKSKFNEIENKMQ